VYKRDMEPIMAETTTITVRIPIALKDKLDRLADVTKRSRSFLAAEALDTYTRNELEIVEGILEGMAEVDAGHFYTQRKWKSIAGPSLRNLMPTALRLKRRWRIREPRYLVAAFHADA